MKNIIIFNIFSLILLTSCNESKARPEKEIVNIKNSAQPSIIISLDTVLENRFAYLKEFQMLNSEIIVKVDYVDYLTDREALDAEWRDEAYYIDGDDTITSITDGYYISNLNLKLRTFKLQDNISVKHMIYNDVLQELSESKPINEKQIEKYIENEVLLFLYIKNGIIIRIDERFIP
jgi:mannitol/fructose-specific phosphotransferase system IIA component